MTPGNDRHSFLHSHLLLPLTLSPILIYLAACGSGAGSSLHGSTTAVTVLATSTADDRLTQFTMGLTGLSLVSNTGKEVPVITSPIYTEFIHLNGENEPLLTANVPQGTYTSAIASVGFSILDCVMVSQQGGLNGIGLSTGNVRPKKVAISLPNPIEIGSESTTILLNMFARPSSSEGVCDKGIADFAVAPTFNLTQPAKSVGAINNLQGIVQAVNGDESFTVSSIDGPNLSINGSSGTTEVASAPQWQVNSTASTVFQGIHDASSLVAGQPVDMDVTLQHGLLAATRISVYDTNTSNLSLFSGPLLSANSLTAPVLAWARIGIGSPQYLGMTPFSLTGAQFGISSAFTNLGELPFTAEFDASRFTWGQAVEVTTHQPLYSNNYLPVTTITLLPQTVNGAVQAISTNGNFTEYTISLASYDLFPQLALQWGQSTHLDSPDIITVYVDKNARLQTAVPVAVGGIYRFNGLVFNDNGALRMDCARISDGVID